MAVVEMFGVSPCIVAGLFGDDLMQQMQLPQCQLVFDLSGDTTGPQYHAQIKDTVAP